MRIVDLSSDIWMEFPAAQCIWRDWHGPIGSYSEPTRHKRLIQFRLTAGYVERTRHKAEWWC